MPQTNSLSFLANPKYVSYIYKTKASVVLVNPSFEPSLPLPKTLTLIRVENAYESLAELLRYYDNLQKRPQGIEQPVFIHESAEIGKSVYMVLFLIFQKG